MTDAPRPTIRIDKWLWYARFFKTRGLAAKTVTSGHVRVNATRVSKASSAIGPGDTLTFPQGHAVRVVRLIDVGTRRGPAPEAQALYEDLSPPPPKPPAPQAQAPRFDRGGRPTKKDRRQGESLRGRDLD